MAESAVTDVDFERLSWHDNHIYGIHLSLGDAARDDWRSDLVFDIDHIVEWLCGVDKRVQFRVAPATLAFHHVTDLDIDIDWGDSGYQTAIHEASIDGVTRDQVSDQKICLDRPCYRWRIETNWPNGGVIAFGASGFTQKLRAAPVLIRAERAAPVLIRAETVAARPPAVPARLKRWRKFVRLACFTVGDWLK